MSKNLKKRIYTSIILILMLFVISINNFALGYVLIIAGILSALEFFKMNLIIFKKNKIMQTTNNILFTLYLFTLLSTILYFSSFIHLKILLFIVLLICIASDIGGYIFGKIFQGKKLTKISPNKTISGAFGSLISSSLFSILIIYYLTGRIDLAIILIGLVTSISCQIGDLFFSYLKRKSNLKDTGNFLPGHGGILDRIDGMLLGIPIGFLIFIFIF